MNHTQNLNLNLPEYEDEADIDSINENMQTLDFAVTDLDEDMESKITFPSGGTAGQVLELDENGEAQWGDKLPTEDIVVAVQDWMETNVPPHESYIVDQSLSISGAAADAKVTGDRLRALENAEEAGLVYTRPEDFGAVGDGVTDDTMAINDAIAYAIEHNIAVRGYGQYKTSLAISVTANFLDMYLHSVTYSGTNCGLSVTGQYNNIRFDLLYCTNGRGIVMDRPANFNCSWNKITIMRLFAHDHGVYFNTHSESQFILYNTFDIRVVKSEIGDCFHGDDHVAENVYMNTTCFCENGWAIYRCAGRFYNFTLERYVYNGIYCTSGSCFWSGFRIREMVDKWLRYRSGRTQYNGGCLIKYVGADYAVTRWVGDDAIPYECIDASEMVTPEELLDDYSLAETDAERNEILDQMSRMNFYQSIDAPIRIGDWDSNGYGLLMIGKRMIVQGGRKICIPYGDLIYTIFGDYDMRDATYTTNHPMPYPTKFIIGANNVNIYLPASYCPAGYKEFYVEQDAYNFCNIYDYNDSTTPIFNGSDYGAGLYKITAYTIPGESCVRKANPSKHQAFFDSSNYGWEIENARPKMGGIVNIASYGAIGDGVTDDSAAFRRAFWYADDVYLESNKTYYLGSVVRIEHDVKIHGGENTVIKTKTPEGGVVNDGIVVRGTVKLSTTLTSDYIALGESGDNRGNKLTLADSTGVKVGDIVVVRATDQFYSYARQYYYLGAAMLITDTDGTSFYVNEGMPYDITKTANLTVTVYDAPNVLIENIHFESDRDSGSAGAYNYLLQIQRCRMPIVRNCTFNNANNALLLQENFGSLVENVNISNIKEDNTVGYDGYGCGVYGCMNTTFYKVTGQGGQSTIDLSGTITNINTWIKECDLMGECRTGLGMHENAYNTVVEDSIIAGATMYGTVIFNRCTFVKNPKLTSLPNVSFRGSHNPEWAKLKMYDCVFPSDNSVGITLLTPACQTPIQSFDSIIGRVEIKNCDGGRIQYTPTLDQYILSCRIQEINIENWKNCGEFYNSGLYPLDILTVKNCTFVTPYWLNNHGSAFVSSNVGLLRIQNDYPQKDTLIANLNKTGRLCLSPNSPITISATNSSARYWACGSNIVSNKVADNGVGTVGGATGEAITRTPNDTFSGALQTDANGNLLFVQPQTTTGVAIYPYYAAYVKDRSYIKASAKIRNVGSTSGASFRLYIAIVDASTGLIRYKGNGTGAQATAAGVTITHERDVAADSLVFVYIQCYSTYVNAQTVIEKYVAKIMPHEISNVLTYDAYQGSSITGSGTLYSVAGENNIMSNSTSAVSIAVVSDLVAGSIATNMNGVSF